MKINRFAMAAALAALTAMAAFGQGGRGPARPGLTLTSPAFPDGGEIPVKYSAASDKLTSPKLEWTNVPDGVQSFALIMHDLDVAKNKTTEDQLHWLIFNIPGSAREIAEGIAADAKMADGTVQAKNGGNTVGYRGPGAQAIGPHHHYTFEFYALDTKLDLGPEATRADVLKAMEGHIVAKAALAARFKRPQ